MDPARGGLRQEGGGLSGTRPAAGFAWRAAVSPVHDAAALRPLLDAYGAALRGLGGEACDPGAAPAAAPQAFFVATGGTERQLLDGVPADPRRPMLLIAHPGHNSLPAALEVLARLRQEGRRGSVCSLRDPGDGEGLARLAEAVCDAAVRHALLAARIGLVGEPSDWLVASAPAPATLARVWGPTVVPLPLEPLLADADGADTADAEAFARDFRAGAEAVAGPADADLLAAGRVYARLRGMVDAERLDAVAVRCFDLVTRRATTGCLALARLNDEGVLAGCEGDLPATVTMLWLRRLTGEIPWMANPARLDPERGLLTLAHCTAPRRLTRTYRLRSHFESGLGVAVQGALGPGPVTLARIGGVDMERLWAADAALLRDTDHPDLCRTQVEIEAGREVLADLLARPLGNHLVLVRGHHAAALRRWHAAMIG